MKKLIAILIMGLFIFSFIPTSVEARVIGNQWGYGDKNTNFDSVTTPPFNASYFLHFGSDSNPYGNKANGVSGNALNVELHNNIDASGWYLSYDTGGTPYLTTEFDLYVQDNTTVWKDNYLSYSYVRIQWSSSHFAEMHFSPLVSDYYYDYFGYGSLYEPTNVFKNPRETWFHCIISFDNVSGFTSNLFMFNKTYSLNQANYTATWGSSLIIRLGATVGWEGTLRIDNINLYKTYKDMSTINTAIAGESYSPIFSIARSPYNYNGAIAYIFDCDNANEKSNRIIWNWLANYSMHATRTTFAFQNATDYGTENHLGYIGNLSWRNSLLNISNLGNEIALHGASYYNDTTLMMISAMENFTEIFGCNLSTYAEHGDYTTNEEQLWDGNGTDAASPFYILDALANISYSWLIQHSYISYSAPVNTERGNAIRFPVYFAENESLFRENTQYGTFFLRTAGNTISNIVNIMSDGNISEFVAFHGIGMVYAHENLLPAAPANAWNEPGNLDQLNSSISDVWLKLMANETILMNANDLLDYLRVIDKLKLYVTEELFSDVISIVNTDPLNGTDGITILVHDGEKYKFTDYETGEEYYQNDEYEINIGNISGNQVRTFIVTGTILDISTTQNMRMLMHNSTNHYWRMEFNNDSVGSYNPAYTLINGQHIGQPFWNPDTGNFAQTEYHNYPTYDQITNIDLRTGSPIVYETLPVVLSGIGNMVFESQYYDPGATIHGQMLMNYHIHNSNTSFALNNSLYLSPNLTYTIIIDGVITKYKVSTDPSGLLQFDFNMSQYSVHTVQVQISGVFQWPDAFFYSGNMVVAVLGAVGLLGMAFCPIYLAASWKEEEGVGKIRLISVVGFMFVLAFGLFYASTIWV